MLEFIVSTFDLHKYCKSFFLVFNVLKFQSICCSVIVEQFGHNNKESTSDRMDKSITLDPVGNIQFFASLFNSTLSAEIVEGSIKLFTSVKS